MEPQSAIGPPISVSRTITVFCTSAHLYQHSTCFLPSTHLIDSRARRIAATVPAATVPATFGARRVTPVRRRWVAVAGYVHSRCGGRRNVGECCGGSNVAGTGVRHRSSRIPTVFVTQVAASKPSAAKALRARLRLSFRGASRKIIYWLFDVFRFDQGRRRSHFPLARIPWLN